MDNETQTIQVGQRVKWHGKPYTVTERQANPFNDTLFLLEDVNGDQYVALFHDVTLLPSESPIESDPTPQPPAIQYPPLRVLIDGKPSQTWQQVLESKPLAERQPHLYLRGYYDFVIANMVELTSFLKNFRVLVMDFNPPLDQDDENDFGTYRVFIITEGA